MKLGNVCKFYRSLTFHLNCNFLYKIFYFFYSNWCNGLIFFLLNILHCFIVAQYFDPTMSDTAVSLVKQLVLSGADLNIADNQGWRPIYQAAYGGNYGLYLYFKKKLSWLKGTDTVLAVIIKLIKIFSVLTKSKRLSLLNKFVKLVDELKRVFACDYLPTFSFH